MTNGPNEKGGKEILANPYPKGSARYKMKQRQLDKIKKKIQPKPKPKTDKTKRRKSLDDYLDSTE